MLNKRIVVFVSLLLLAPVLALPVAYSKGETTHTVQVGAGLVSPSGALGELMRFGPSVSVIRTGDTVTWNLVAGLHSVTATDLAPDKTPIFDSSPNFDFSKFSPETLAAFFGPGGALWPGSSWELDTSNIPVGTYHFVCKIHFPFMNGTLTITQPTAQKGFFHVRVGMTAPEGEFHAFSPSDIVVPQGTIVVFSTGNAIDPHTVTSLDKLPNGQEVPAGLLFDSSPKANQAAEEDLEKLAFSPGGLMFQAPPGVPLPPGIQPYTTFSYTFTTPGVFQYYCKLHSSVGPTGERTGMVGYVVVLPYATSDEVNSLNNQLSSTASSLNNQLSSTSSSLTNQAQQLTNRLSTAENRATSLQAQLDSVSGQLNTSYYVGIGGVVIAIVALGLAVAARRKPA